MLNRCNCTITRGHDDRHDMGSCWKLEYNSSIRWPVMTFAVWLTCKGKKPSRFSVVSYATELQVDFRVTQSRDCCLFRSRVTVRVRVSNAAVSEMSETLITVNVILAISNLSASNISKKIKQIVRFWRNKKSRMDHSINCCNTRMTQAQWYK